MQVVTEKGGTDETIHEYQSDHPSRRNRCISGEAESVAEVLRKSTCAKSGQQRRVWSLFPAIIETFML